jgi:hypothetical protein
MRKTSVPSKLGTRGEGKVEPLEQLVLAKVEAIGDDKQGRCELFVTANVLAFRQCVRGPIKV